MHLSFLKTSSLRPPAAAGRFYPGDPGELRSLVEALLAAAPAGSGPGPKALIAPHAGYLYSGPIAASAYAHWLPARDQIRRVVLLGPAHFVPFRGVASSSAEAFATPLGLVRLDTKTIQALCAAKRAILLDEAHAREHSLEVHLPFLQVLLAEFTLVPLAVGEAEPAEISELLEALWGGPETRLVISSDLSHFLDSEAARRLDGLTAQAIEQLQPEGVGEQQACGRLPIQGLLYAARRHALRVRAVDLRNSGDTAGPAGRVVGYGAFVFDEPNG